MEKYLEFQNLKLIEDKKNSFCRLYEYEDGSRFYIEPIFYALLENFKVQYPQEFDIVLKKMEELVRKNKKVIFTGMDEETEDDPVTQTDEDYIILTFYDITDMLNIYINNKSRGSDYGD